MSYLKQQPIGIFDSGIGGLTVAHAVAQALPYEDIIYFGDLAHLPYGDKSAATIQRYCKHIADFLLEQKCKIILVACNSATAAAYEMLQQYLHNKVLLLSVVDPIVAYIENNLQYKKIGLIGTKQTVNSKIFDKKIAAIKKDISFKSLATPLLVPVIEEGFYHKHELVDQVLALYFSDSELIDTDALILGCTHYPVIKSRIDAFFKQKVELLDEAEISAGALKDLLAHHDLLNPQTKLGEHQFFVSDYTQAFAKMANAFFGDKINLKVQVLEEV